MVDKDREAAFRQTTAEWLEPTIPGARLVGPKWYPVKVDWAEVALAMDANSGKVSKSAMERFGTENGVEVCMMRWLGRPRPNGQHASVVVNVATKEDAEKLLKSESVTAHTGLRTENAQSTGKRRSGYSRASVMNRELRILQANMKRGREAQHALHNDPALADFHFILDQEPGCFLADGEVVLHGTNPRWTKFIASGRRQGSYPVRSCIWASRDVAATQVQVGSADITAIVALVGGRKLVIVSVYIPDLCSRRTKEENLEALTSRLDMINELV
ncbi:hypothetical protein K469DRAFT_574672 [Zopfia rhizophila CBS 207.26]|uniref:Uncharacterized protein n=1 Tax=Zopfia rhizophila CBS 207.26 TaxID=1314779 RepID=A0A6A6E682_9PEZI|nr:hypothetical protein K469DRAFT_574672 [Zopfia rhizophila CBS 207.26]